MNSPSSPSSESTPSFHREISLFDAIMLVAGTMIGSGIFLTSTDMARDLGSSGWLMACWALTGVITLFGALCYAELSAMMPRAGGQYIFLREAYSPLWGFLYGWTLFMVIQTGSIAAVSIAFAKFLGVLVPALGTDNVIHQFPFEAELYFPFISEPIFQRETFEISAGQIVAVFTTLLLTAVNCRGVEEGKWVQNIFGVAKTAGLILLIVLGLTVAANPDAIELNNQDWWGGVQDTDTTRDVGESLGLSGGLLLALMVAGGAMVGSLFSADAWNNLTFTAGEVKNPQKNIPRGLALGVGLVMVLYMLANLAYLAALPLNGSPEGETAFERGIAYAEDGRVGTAVLELATPRFGVPIMAVAIMISTFGCVNGMVLMGARLYYAMARDGLFFRAVGQLNRKGVPAAALIFQGVWSCLLIFSGTYFELLDYVIFAALLFYVLTVIGLFILRRKQPNAERPYRVTGYPIVPAVFIVLCTAIMVDLLIVKPAFTWPGLIIVLTGIPIYFFWRLTGRKPPPDQTSV